MNVNPVSISDLNLVGSSVISAADALGLARDQLAEAIGVSVSTVARMKNGSSPVPEQKPFEMSLLLIRVYRSLFSILGGNNEAMKHWMNTPNQHLGEEVPAELIRKADGLTRVLWYLDAMRGRI
ncbi:MAG TPA: antitoxin Xre/MbcA/ParS toxin-binding domain-containing protein [Cellvibrio sp.]|nr:antitoxin Xre/MbcA/ParS toxin-binding domain-containing protein [Cellvibrio sp.]